MEPFIDTESGATIDSWVDGDSSCPTHEHMADSEIIQSLTSENTDLDITEDDEDEEPEPPPKITEALVGLQTGLQFLEELTTHQNQPLTATNWAN
ncbi:hypothetical protein FKM82_008865 [Ascaphus truei]